MLSGSATRPLLHEWLQCPASPARSFTASIDPSSGKPASPCSPGVGLARLLALSIPGRKDSSAYQAGRDTRRLTVQAEARVLLVDWPMYRVRSGSAAALVPFARFSHRVSGPLFLPLCLPAINQSSSQPKYCTEPSDILPVFECGPFRCHTYSISASRCTS